jgi:hypothetical protein
MALVSPGVEVTIIDESNYISAATNSVPYILIATAQNKISGTGIGVAAGTLESNADKVYLITSQRDLAATFGTPFFYKTAQGTPINGYELNEYGLLAAFSVLGVSNRAYVQRANVDLAALNASLVRPTGSPADGTYWLDTTETSWGMFQWNAVTGAFTVQSVLVISDVTQTVGSVPIASVGSIGNYAVVVNNPDIAGSANNFIYYKNTNNQWVVVGSDAWKRSWPTVQGTTNLTGVTNLTGTLQINGINVVVPGAGTLASLVSTINTLAIPGVTAVADSSNRLVLLADSAAESGSLTDGGLIEIGSGSTAGLLTALGITADVFYAPALQQSPNFTVPRWLSSDPTPRPTGSVWQITTAVNDGMDLVVKEYDADIGAFVIRNVAVFANLAQANNQLDPQGGGANIPPNTIIATVDSSAESLPGGDFNNTASQLIYRRLTSGATLVRGSTTTPVFVNGNQFGIRATQAGSNQFSNPVTATISGTTAASFVAAVSAANVPFVSAQVNSDGSITMIHSQGGTIALDEIFGTPVSAAGFTTANPQIRSGGDQALAGYLVLSNWVVLDYQASAGAPDATPVNNTPWYYSAVDQADIMIHNGTTWVGYQTVDNDVRGFNLTLTDPNGPIFSASEPTQQSDNTALELGDLWIDTSDLELYPLIRRWQRVQGVAQWVPLNNTDQTTSNGVLFADARWATNGTTNPITDNIPTIQSLLVSNYLDLDAPNPGVYPAGMLLFNTRRSGFNIKSFRVNYFNPQTFAVDAYSPSTAYLTGDKTLFNGVVYVALQNTTGNVPTNPTFWALLQTNAWVTAVGNRQDGSPYMGRLAQRQVIVQAMKSAIDTSDTLREEQLEYNLLATPGYPELIVNMVRLNNERSNTGFIVGDTPMRLPPNGNDIVAWATDAGGLGFPTGDGLTTSDPYVGVFYPACLTTDLTGSQVVQPSSHMMLRTIVRNDEVAFPWLAPAGVRRGVIDNAQQIGYINSATGEFVTIATGQGLRDVLYVNKINPITFIPGVGITNYGNKTESAITSALDRINVARLVAFIRGRLNEIGKQFVFEPNDQITRNEIANAIDGLMIDLIAKRGIYDYLVVCDLSNNTPARIDRNELYVDIAIEPVKAVEFIYIPVRIKNTGELASGQIASSNSV